MNQGPFSRRLEAHRCLEWAERQTHETARPSDFPTKTVLPSGQLAQRGVILIVGFDGRLRVRRLERLLEQTNLSCHARDETVETFTSYTGSLTISLSADAP